MALKFVNTMYTVYSGNISEVGYQYDHERKCGVMRVVFNKGKTYDYFPVPKELFEQIFIQESKGSWFATNIRNGVGIIAEEVKEESS